MLLKADVGLPYEWVNSGAKNVNGYMNVFVCIVRAEFFYCVFLVLGKPHAGLLGGYKPGNMGLGKYLGAGMQKGMGMGGHGIGKSNGTSVAFCACSKG